MENDQPEEENSRKISDVLRNLSVKGGPFSISIAKIVGSSRSIPSGKDYHFYNNFPEFKSPIDAIRTKSTVILDTIGESDCIIGKRIAFPDDKGIEVDDDLASDFLEDVNDGIIEKVDGSFDYFDRVRKVEEESDLRMMRADGTGGDENGFQMVLGKKSKKLMERGLEGGLRSGGQEAKVAVKVKAKVPFHVPTISRPQDEYKIIVNNTNQPFEHVWLQRSEDGSRFIHPLEKLSVLDFIDTSDSTSEPVKPPPLEETPFKLVEELKDLKQLVNKLRSVDEFAVDLEHNQYRSFQGLTCLMQISTRTEDFIIDTLKLRIQIGPHLRDLFKDPTKRKVMHGADRDIVWLQRDFGIYVCNMFDTGQASRVLKMERLSLEHLLHYFCGVAANKEYQNADWRIRPLPQEMIKYAREDTHYLLYIYDLMRKRLLMASAESESSDTPLVGVYKRSYEICSQLYEKELLTESSYLYVYGVQGAELNAQQLAVLSGLCEWRDAVARSEDESTGYVLPNRTLIEIAKEMPLTTNKLCRVLKSKHPYIERNLGSVVSIIRHSIQNTAAFEEAAKYFKERRLKIANEENTLVTEESEALPSEAPEILQNADEDDNVQNSTSPNDRALEKKFNSSPMENEIEKSETDGLSASVQRETLLVPEHPKHINTNMISSHSAEVTVQTIKKPTRAFGALFGNSAKRKFDPDKKEQEDNKLEQIKSTVSLPFHTFSGKYEQLQPDAKKSDEEMLEASHKDVSAPATGSSVEDVIVLEDDSDTEESAKCEIEEGDEPMSLSDLSSSFEKCLPSVDQTMSSKQDEKSQQSEGLLQIKPFDYEAARMQVKFKGDAGAGKKEESDGNNARSRVNRKKGSVTGPDEGATEFGQGRRRQAFPASGNRSATFR